MYLRVAKPSLKQLSMNSIMYRIAIILVLVTSQNRLYSQNVLSKSDLSQVKVDQLSDEEISKYMQQFQSSGLSQEQAEQLALSRGFPASELAKLRLRLTTLSPKSSTNTNSTTGNNLTTDRSVNSNLNQTSEVIQTNPKIFGSELFTTSSLAFQPDLKIATPVNYELGPDDQLNISVYGVQEASFKLTISPDGTIYIPNVGLIKIAGETIEAATAKIKNRMASIAYGSLQSGASKLSVTLGDIRTLRITIIGAAKPGTYAISSLSSLFNALYLAGGPAANGSYREIELLRNNKVARTVDLYKFLTRGSQEDNVRLRENDVIRIPVYKTRVDIEGEVKRPGIFELLPNETINDLLNYASGFTDNAYRASVKIIQLTDKEKRVKDLYANEFALYKPNTGDNIQVSQILNRFQNRVSITGAVFRPGFFEISANSTVGQLIRNAEGLREDAYTKRAQIVRLQEDLTSEIISFDVTQVLQGGSKDIILKREDSVIISSIFDLRDDLPVTVQGEVRKPGNYKHVDSLTLKDLILQAGGFTVAAYPERIEIARVIKRDTLTAQDVRLSEIIDLNDISDLSLSSKNIQLKPFDVVTVRRLPGYLELKSVTATGQVQYPGPYVLSNRSERISSLLKRAGGLAPEAFAEGAYLRRANAATLTTNLDSEKAAKIQRQIKDSTGHIPAEIARPYDQIPLDLSQIIQHPGGEIDLILKPGDELFIPRNDEEIKIRGEVLFPTQAPFDKYNSLGDYIGSAGGFTDNARKNKLYVLYPNGKAAKTKHFLFFRSYPEIKPGSEVIVPGKVEKVRNNNLQQTAILASVLASVAGIVIALVRLL